MGCFCLSLPGLLLAIFGIPATATITKIEETGRRDDRFAIYYRYLTRDEKEVTASIELDTLGNLEVGGPLAIRYATFSPTFNMFEDARWVSFMMAGVSLAATAAIIEYKYFRS